MSTNDLDKNNLTKEHLDGMQLPTGQVLKTIPKHIVDLQIELMSHHRSCLQELETMMQGDNYSPELFYGGIAAYCGVVLDGSYGQEYLAEMLLKELYRKRGVPVINTGKVVPMSKELLQ